MTRSFFDSGDKPGWMMFYGVVVMALVETMAKNLNAKYREPFSIESSTKRDAALDGADFVATSPAFER